MSVIATENHTLHVHDMAVQTITKMHEQTALVQAHWARVTKTTPPERMPSAENLHMVLEMQSTLVRNLAQMTQTGLGRETRVFRDGELSLFVRTASGMVYGMIFHRSFRPDAPQDDDPRPTVTPAPVMGRFCVDGLGRTPHPCNKPIERNERTCEGHDLVIASLPVPGTWSFHS